jgi:hypothetical protein
MIMDDDPLDPDVLSAMEALAPHPARDPEDEAHGLKNFLAAAEMVRHSSPQATTPRQSRPAALPDRQKAPARSQKPARFGLKALAASFILLVVVFFGAGGATTQAARESLPGDTLYYVKTALEDVRITLSVDAAQNAELHLLFARRRLDELLLLIEMHRYENVEHTAEQHNYHLSEAEKLLDQIAAIYPQHAQELASAIADMRAETAQVLDRLHNLAPIVTAPVIDQALDKKQLGAENEDAKEINPTNRPNNIPQTYQEPKPTPTPPQTVEQPKPQQPTAQPTESQPQSLDLDISKFQVEKKVSLDKNQPVKILLEVKNNGQVEGEGTATVTGVQGGVEVYNQSMPVSDAVGGAFRRYTFPDFVPTASGEIVWTVSLGDGDPDVDAQVEVTRVEDGGDPGGGELGSLDLDIHNFKIPASIKLQKGRAIEFQLDIKNNGSIDGQGTVTITGVQNGVEVYSQTWTVTDALGGGHSRYAFPGYTPGAPGEIVWAITLNDGDADDDTIITATLVEP